MSRTKITVIDSLMGSGKTSYAIQYINNHPEQSFVYCTPFLDEVQRIKEQCVNAHFHDPTCYSGRKIDDFNRLLMEGKNIVLTHATFANADEDTLEYISNTDYVLIMDETLNVLENFNNVCSDSRQTVTKADIRMLRDSGCISVDDYGKVSWIGDSYRGGKFSDAEKYAKNGTLLYIDQSMFVWQFPASIFESFKETYVLTYLFEGSILKPYFQYHSIPFALKSVYQADGKYEIKDYDRDQEKIRSFNGLINIYNNAKANDYRGTSLSKKWYSSNADKLPILKKYLHNFFQNRMRAKAQDILWTCPKDYYKQLKGKGYIRVRKLTQDESILPKTEKEKIEKKLSCFLSSNAKATNDYKERSVLAYCVNMFLNPYTKKYFKKKNLKDGTQIEVNEDMFALSCMLQWIFRSQVREGKPITVYIPSVRMRNLLQRWLDLKI